MSKVPAVFYLPLASWTNVVLVLLVVCFLLLPSAVFAQSPNPPDRDQVKRWVEGIGKPSYSKRELASEQLKKLSGPSLELFA